MIDCFFLNSLQIAHLRRELAMSKDVAVQEVEARNKYLSAQLESMEKVVAQKTSAVSSVGIIVL